MFAGNGLDGSVALDASWKSTSSPTLSSPMSARLAASKPVSTSPVGGTSRAQARPKSALPAFVADDKKILRFSGYFREPVHWEDGPLGVGDKESDRIRLCALTINVVEQSLMVNEKTERNAGLLGGAFYKGRLPSRADGTQVEISDFRVGGTVELLNRTMHICDADKPTREYFRRYLGYFATHIF